MEATLHTEHSHAHTPGDQHPARIISFSSFFLEHLELCLLSSFLWCVELRVAEPLALDPVAHGRQTFFFVSASRGPAPALPSDATP